MTSEEKIDKQDHWAFLSQSLDGNDMDTEKMNTETENNQENIPQPEPRRRGRPRKRPLEDGARSTDSGVKRRGRKRASEADSDQQLPLEKMSTLHGTEETRVNLTIGGEVELPKPKRRGRPPMNKASRPVETTPSDPWTVLASQIGEIGTTPDKPLAPKVADILPEVPVNAPAPGDPALNEFFADLEEEPLEINWGKPQTAKDESPEPVSKPIRSSEPKAVEKTPEPPKTLDPKDIFTSMEEEPLTIDWGRSPKKQPKTEEAVAELIPENPVPATNSEFPSERPAREERFVAPRGDRRDRGGRGDRGDRRDRNNRGERNDRNPRNDRNTRNDRRDRSQQGFDRQEQERPLFASQAEESNEFSWDKPMDDPRNGRSRRDRRDDRMPRDENMPRDERAPQEESFVLAEKAFEEPLAEQPRSRDMDRGRGRGRRFDRTRDDSRPEQRQERMERPSFDSAPEPSVNPENSCFKFNEEEELPWPSEEAAVREVPVREAPVRNREPRRDRNRGRNNAAPNQETPDARDRSQARTPSGEPRVERPGLSWDDAILNVVQFNLDRHGNKKK